MSKKHASKSSTASTKANEKARREALAVTRANLEKIDAAARNGRVTSPAIDPKAQQVACVDVDPKAEMAAAKKHAAKGRKALTEIHLPASLPLAVLNDGKPATAENIKAAEAKERKGKKPPKGGKPKAAKPDKPKRLSALDAAAQVLAKSDKPMTSQALIDAMAERKLWTSPGGKTPAATLYAAMLREVAAKGRESRFKKVDRGLFIASGKGA